MLFHSSLRAGAAETSLHPPHAAPLLGTIQRADGVHDDLAARALFLSDGQQRVAIVCFDLIGMDLALVDQIREAIQLRTGIASVFLNCSHTHSAPFTIPWSVLGTRWFFGQGSGWRSEIVRATAELVARAEASAVPATLRAGRSEVRLGSNRRLPTEGGVVMKSNPRGPTVPWTDVLRIEGPRNETIAVLFSHAAHPVIIHGASKLVSAEYPGFAARALRDKLGERVIPLFAQGCAGDINADPLRGGLAESQRAGVELANAVYAALDRSESVSAAMAVRSINVNLPLAHLPERDECIALLKVAEDKLRERCGRTDFTDEELWGLQDRVPAPKSQSESKEADDTQPMENQPWWLMDNVLCLRDLLSKIIARDETPLRFEVQLLRLGEQWSLVTASHELFSNYQLWADATIPSKHNMVLSYTNGCESYIPTDEALGSGGYEAASFPSLDGAAIKYKHRRAVAPGVEQRVIETLMRLWS